MKIREMLILPALAAGLFTTASCTRDRAEMTSATPTGTTGAEEERRDYVTRLEQRVNDLSARLDVMQQAQTAGRQVVGDARLDSIRENLRELREEIADLRATGNANWWPATERAFERSYRGLQDEIGTTAGTGTRARTELDRSPVTGVSPAEAPAADWMQRRDQFVSRMEADIQALEQQLNRGGVSGEQMQEVRIELGELRNQVAGLRDVTAENWWERTRQRLDRSMEDVERSIEGLNDNQRSGTRQ